MADVQTENGYTRIANELLEEICKCKFNGTQLRIIMTVWRFTYGFHRKQHDLSLNFIADHICVDKARIKKELKLLIQANVILEVEKASFNKTRVIAFNKDYEQWKVCHSSAKGTQGSKTTTVVENSNTTGVINNPTTGVINNPQEIKDKETFKETNTVEELLMKIESFNDLSGKAGVIVGFMNQKYPDRKRFGIKGNITANDVFTKYLKDGFSAERLLVAIDQSDEELSPWDAVEKSRNVVTESQKQAERLSYLWDTYHLGEDYYKEFGDINEYNKAIEELKHLGQL